MTDTPRMPDALVWVDPSRQSGDPCVMGTSVPVDALAEFVWAGDLVDNLAELYSVTRRQVIGACWYMARHGSRTWRERWREWLTAAEPRLWAGSGDVADPPSRPQGGN